MAIVRPILLLLAALLAPAGPAFAANTPEPLTVEIVCRNGQAVAIRVPIDAPGPGVLTLQLPPADICKSGQETPTAPPQLPAPSTNTRRPTRST